MKPARQSCAVLCSARLGWAALRYAVAVPGVEGVTDTCSCQLVVLACDCAKLWRAKCNGLDCARLGCVMLCQAVLCCAVPCRAM